MIDAAVSDLMDACVAAGSIRTDITPGDLSTALAGIALSSARPDQREQAERLLGLVLDGLTARRRRATAEAADGPC